MDPKKKRIVIVGGGISGLATAWFLKSRGQSDVRVLEGSETVGGCIRTTESNGFLVEEGPNGFLVNQGGIWNLAHQLGLGRDLTPGSAIAGKNRYLLNHGTLTKLPSSLVGFLFNPLLSPWGRIRVLAEPLIPKKRTPSEESIQGFSLRRLGPEATALLLDPFVAGIHAGDPARLSATSAFPRLSGLETRYGSIFWGLLRGGLGQPELTKELADPKQSRIWSFRKGLGQLVQALCQAVGTVQVETPLMQVKREGQQWVLESPRGSLQADLLVLACPPPAASTILKAEEPELAKILGTMRTNTLVMVALGFDRAQVGHPLDGFGYLVPSREKRNHLGVQWCSSIYPGRAPAGKVLLRVLMGGTTRSEMAERDSQALIQVALDEVRKDLKIQGDPCFATTKIWKPAIPQYELGHAELVARLKDIESRKGDLFFAGNYLAGVSLNDCVAQAADCASRIERALTT